MFADAATPREIGQTQAKDTEAECAHGQQIRPEYRREGTGRALKTSWTEKPSSTPINFLTSRPHHREA